jgi:WD40 repeat protein
MLVLKPAAGVRPRLDQLAFSPDGRTLAAPAVGRGALVWKSFAAGARAELVPTRAGRGLVRVAFAPDGRLLLGNSQLFAVHLPSGAATRVPTDEWHVLGFAAASAGHLVVSEYQRSGEATVLTCWHMDDFDTALWRHEMPAHVYLPPAIGPDGTLVLIESRRQPVSRHWQPHRVRRSLDTGDVLDVARLSDHPEGFALSPDGATVAVRLNDSVYFMPAAGAVGTGAHVRNDTPKHFTGIAFHPSGKYLAATSNDATVKLYDVATLGTARTFTWDIGRMRSVAFSPDGTLAAAGSDGGKVVLWDVDV